ncbi:MAG: hypothetical protein V1719_02815 [Patescibacteria group bacterium]
MRGKNQSYINRMPGTVVGAFILLFLIIVFGRIFSDEDTWLCDNGLWVKHGNPASPQPTEPCDINTYSNTNTDIVLSTTFCEQITDYQECRNRQNCLAYDLCSCSNDYEQQDKCGQELSVPCLCIIGGFDRCITLDCSDSRIDKSQYYANLRDQCDDSCCRASVDNMEEGDYTIKPEDEDCPTGLQIGGLKCINSYNWCE